MDELLPSVKGLDITDCPSKSLGQLLSSYYNGYYSLSKLYSSANALSMLDN